MRRGGGREALRAPRDVQAGQARLLRAPQAGFEGQTRSEREAVSFSVHFDDGFDLNDVREFSASEMVGRLSHKRGEAVPSDGLLKIGRRTWRVLWTRHESDARGGYLATALKLVEEK